MYRVLSTFSNEKEFKMIHKSLKVFRPGKFYFFLPLILLCLIFTFSVSIFAQLDTSFGTNGVTTTDVFNSDLSFGLYILSDQKILVVDRGQVSDTGQRKYFFIRYNADGSLDSTFGTNGIKELSIPEITRLDLRTSARQPDGKIILAGTDNNDGVIVRLNEDGTLDTGFGTNGVHRPNIVIGQSDGILDIAVLPDGKILATGTIQNMSTKVFLLKYNSNGVPDINFGIDGYIIHNFAAQMQLNSILLQSDGKIILAPTAEFNTIGVGNIKRFNADGTIDNSFTNTPVFFNLKSLAVLPNDKLIGVLDTSTTDNFNRNDSDVTVIRFNSDGTTDTSFGTGGTVTIDLTTSFNDNGAGLTIMPDGRIIIGAQTRIDPNRSLIRGSHYSLIELTPDGTVSGKFIVVKSGIYVEVLISALPDGKILSLIKADDSSSIDVKLVKVNGIPFPKYHFKGNPFDYGLTRLAAPPSDAAADFSVFRPSDLNWYIYDQFPGFRFGLADDILVPADYLGKLSTDLGVFRPSNGTWYFADNFVRAATEFRAIQWGQSGDIPAPADYDDDSKADLAVFRPSNGVWYIRNSKDDSATIFQWGLDGDKPVTGDYDGDGKFDVAVYRPTNNVWYIHRSSDNGFTGIQWGSAGDIPVQEDYDGDGKTDVAIWRPSTQVWYILRSSDGGFSAVQWGLETDYAVPADYDDDLKTDIAVYRPSEGRWYVLRSSDNSLLVGIWGSPGDLVPQRRQ